MLAWILAEDFRVQCRLTLNTWCGTVLSPLERGLHFATGAIGEEGSICPVSVVVIPNGLTVSAWNQCLAKVVEIAHTTSLVADI